MSFSLLLYLMLKGNTNNKSFQQILTGLTNSVIPFPQSLFTTHNRTNINANVLVAYLMWSALLSLQLSVLSLSSCYIYKLNNGRWLGAAD